MLGERSERLTKDLDDIGGESLEGSGFEDQTPDSGFAIENTGPEEPGPSSTEEGGHVD